MITSKLWGSSALAAAAGIGVAPRGAKPLVCRAVDAISGFVLGELRGEAKTFTSCPLALE